MSKHLLNVLAMVIMMALPRPVYAIDRCSALLGDKDHYTRFKRSMADKMRVHVEEVVIQGEALDSLVAGTYDRHSSRVSIDKNSNILEKKITLHHEAVHIKSARNFTKNPNFKTAAMLIEFHDDEGLIDRDLNVNYQSAYSVDEMKAYEKSSLYFASIARDMKHKQHPDARGFAEASRTEQEDALNFAKISLKLLLETKNFLEKAKEENLTITAHPFYNEPSDYFMAYLSVPREKGKTLVVGFPYYEVGAQNKGMIDLTKKKLLETCEEGIKLTKEYSRYLNIIVSE